MELEHELVNWHCSMLSSSDIRFVHQIKTSQYYLTMHFQVDPSWSSCSSVYSLMFCSWSSWSQYIRPCRSRPIGCRRIFSGSSSLMAILNFRLSSNWHSHRYWRWGKRRKEKRRSVWMLQIFLCGSLIIFSKNRECRTFRMLDLHSMDISW